VNDVVRIAESCDHRLGLPGPALSPPHTHLLQAFALALQFAEILGRKEAKGLKTLIYGEEINMMLCLMAVLDNLR